MSDDRSPRTGRKHPRLLGMLVVLVVFGWFPASIAGTVMWVDDLKDGAPSEALSWVPTQGVVKEQRELRKKSKLRGRWTETSLRVEAVYKGRTYSSWVRAGDLDAPELSDAERERREAKSEGRWVNETVKVFIGSDDPEARVFARPFKPISRTRHLWGPIMMVLFVLAVLVVKALDKRKAPGRRQATP